MKSFQALSWKVYLKKIFHKIVYRIRYSFEGNRSSAEGGLSMKKFERQQQIKIIFN